MHSCASNPGELDFNLEEQAKRKVAFAWKLPLPAKEEQMALHHVGSGEVVDLRPEGLEAETGRSVALVKTGSFEAIRLVLAAGAELAPHHVPGEFTLQCLKGAARLSIRDRDVALSSGQWVYLEGGAPHSLRAIEDTVLLLTIILDDSD